ncbi:hypothetical protein GALMADRAFT_234970, partial [Galerina marginata CBS 339.88]
MARAVALYQAEQQKPSTEKKLGLRRICSIVEKEYYKETKKTVSLNHNTLRNLANGGKTLSEFNAEKSWLLEEEAEEVIAYTIELAAQGFGLDHRRLKEHVDEICRARLGSKFPEGGVGQQWTYRFIEKHSDRLHVYTARPLDTLRGQAVNETTNAHWQDVVEDLQLRGDDGNEVAPECTFGMDEGGFQANGAEGWGKVIGAKGKKIQYQQQAGSRETMTVIVTICANGTALPPGVIFAGKGYLVKWRQDNPAKAL